MRIMRAGGMALSPDDDENAGNDLSWRPPHFAESISSGTDHGNRVGSKLAVHDPAVPGCNTPLNWPRPSNGERVEKRRGRRAATKLALAGPATTGPRGRRYYGMAEWRSAPAAGPGHHLPVPPVARHVVQNTYRQSRKRS